MSRVASILRFVPAAESRNDGELLAAFRVHRDEAAFAELVRRHGPLVWGVCRRQLPDHADAEDAFQASFLVLVRRAKSLSGRATVGPWLYKVAAWTARNLRRKNARRLARQSSLAAPLAAPPIEADSRLDIDAALLALPEKYRAPLILCHLEGLSRRDAAERLGCPEGTLSSLLSRGLVKLRFHLSGYVPTVAVPLLLTTAAVRAACAAQLAVGATVNHLIEGVLHMFWVKNATAAMTALVVVFGFGVGIGSTVRYASPALADEKAPQSDAGKPPPTAPKADDELIALKQQQQALAHRALEMSMRLEESHQALRRGLDPKQGGGLTAEQLQAQVRMKKEQAEIEELVKQEKALREPIRDLEAKPAGGGLAIVLATKTTYGTWQYRVKEYNAGGKLVVSLIAEDLATLGVFLARTAKDPAGPKNISILDDRLTPTQRVKDVTEVCKTAGYTQIKLVVPK